MNSFKTLAVAASLAAAASSVSAAEYSFDLAKDGDYAVWDGTSSFSISDGDMTATFTAGAFKDPNVVDDEIVSTTLVDGTIGRYYSGAGVYHNDSDAQHTVDGISKYNNYFDYIAISFEYMGEAVDVALKSLSFGYVTQGSTFALIGDHSGDGSIGAGDSIILEGGALSPYVFADAPEGSLFAVAATPHSSFKLHHVNFDYTPPVNEVPLPAAGWMLLAGVGGIFAAKRRKS